MSKQQLFRKNKSYTKIDTIEQKYGRDFGVRSDKKLGSYLEDKGYGSLTELLNAKDAKPS